MLSAPLRHPCPSLRELPGRDNLIWDGIALTVVTAGMATELACFSGGGRVPDPLPSGGRAAKTTDRRSGPRRQRREKLPRGPNDCLEVPAAHTGAGGADHGIGIGVTCFGMS